MRGSFIRRIINNAQRVLKAIGAMYRLHPVSTLRRSRLTRQVQVPIARPIVRLWIRETYSIPTPCAFDESSYKIMIHHASCWRLRQRAHMKARNESAAEPENFVAVTGACSIFLYLFCSCLYISNPDFGKLDDSERWERPTYYALMSCNSMEKWEITSLLSCCKFCLLLFCVIFCGM